LVFLRAETRGKVGKTCQTSQSIISLQSIYILGGRGMNNLKGFILGML